MRNFLVKMEGFEFAMFKCLPASFPAHFHDYWLVGCLGNGSHQLRLGKRACHLDNNRLLLLNPGEAHSCRALSSASSWRAFHIHPHADWKQTTAFSSSLLDTPSLLKEFDMVSKRILQKSGGSVEETAEKFFRHLLECASEKADPPALPDHLLMGLEALSQEEAIPCLERLAFSAQMGKYRFLRFFSSHYGITPHRYMLNLRLNKARHLLEQGYEPATVAAMSGFYDQAHFTKSFKSSMGFTPGECRKAPQGGVRRKDARK